MVPEPVGKTVLTANYSIKEFWSELTHKLPATNTYKYWIKYNKTI